MKGDMDDRDDIDDVEDERLSLRDMAEMRARFAADLARLDERISLATPEDAAAASGREKESEWMEEHVAHAADAKEMEEIEALDDSDERIFRRMEKGKERDLTFDEAMYFRMEHNLKELAKKHMAAAEIKQKEVDWLEEHVAQVEEPLPDAKRKL